MNNQFDYQNNETPFQQVNLSEPPKGHAKGYSIASLSLGIAAILASCCCCCLYFAGGICGILAIVFAILARRDNGGKMPGMAIAGLILGIVGILLCIVVGVFFNSFSGIPSTPEGMRTFLQELEEMYKDMGIDVDFSDVYEQLDQMQ